MTALTSAPVPSYSMVVVGARRTPLRDTYHALLRMPWWATGLLLLGVYLLANTLFALGYLVTGGVANAQPGSFADAFFFSVQSMATIGYGSLYPASRAANALMVAESVVGLLFTAVATGLVFVRFSLTHSRIVFSRWAAIGPMNGVPTLCIRIGNDRGNQIFDVQMRVVMMHTTVTTEGVRHYRAVDIPLERSFAPALSRSWTLLHRVDDNSPLHGHTPQSVARQEVELHVSISGVDDTSLQVVHGRNEYAHTAMVFGARLADMLTDLPNGDLQVDLRRFHELQGTEPVATFPYSMAVPPVTAEG